MPKRLPTSTSCLLASLLCAAASALAAVKVNPLFTDHMVLQRDIAMPVWGTAEPGEKVTVAFAGRTKTATPDATGKWMVKLDPMPASAAPRTLRVSSTRNPQPATFTNVLVGEVWVCSGQSNMAMPLRGCANADQEIAGARNPLLRLFNVRQNGADAPVTEVAGAWAEAAADTAGNFSGVGYFFGRDLQKALGVPVGLINSSVGGTPAEAWTKDAVLRSNPSFAEVFARHEQQLKLYPQLLERHKAALEKWKQAAAAARKKKEPFATRPPREPYGPNSKQRPSCLYNGMIGPLVPFAIRGAIWYQGEGNSSRAYQYRALLPAMIKNWRDDWGQGQFPFLIVQLAPYMKIQAEPMESAWAELREAQTMTAFKHPNCGLAVITDAGEEDDIHPRLKQPAGARLALAARAIAYGETIEFSGPLYKSMKVAGNKAILTFDHLGGGLVAKDGALKGFTIAGEDRQFHNAEAVIEGTTVVVSSSRVAKPAAVRYGWANFPVVNLWNKAGLPAPPFRTDDWPGITHPDRLAASARTPTRRNP